MHLFCLLGFLPDNSDKQHKAKIFNKVKYLNLNKRLKFQDNSVDAYFSSHVFEHLYRKDLKNLLIEIYRTLKPNGYVRTVLPDLNKIISYYEEHYPNKFLNALFENDNSENYKNYHKWMYTKHSFMYELEIAGFSRGNIKISQYNSSNVEFFLNMDNRPDNSFYIEAKK